jgi:hypothetical protein
MDKKLVSEYPPPIIPYLTPDRETNISNYKEFLQASLDYTLELESHISNSTGNHSKLLNLIDLSRSLSKSIRKDLTILQNYEKPIHALSHPLNIYQRNVRSISKEDFLQLEGSHINTDVLKVTSGNKSISIISVSNIEGTPPKKDTKECPICDEGLFGKKSMLVKHISDAHMSVLAYLSPFAAPPNERKEFPEISILSLTQTIDYDTLQNYEFELEKLDKYHTTSYDQELEITNFKFYLEEHFKEALPGCELQIFGSNMSSLRLRNSDVDMTILVDIHKNTFKHPESEWFEYSINLFGYDQTIQLCERVVYSKLCDILNLLSMRKIEAKLSARVPVLKFETNTSKPFEVDICLNNRLGIENSRLLLTYCSIDPRARLLCITIKFWAKHRNIANTVAGTISSYAYMIMAIHFLQRRPESLLPYLQQNVQERIVDGYNCGFDENIEKYKQRSAENKESISELVCNFFIYYATFDWEDYAVCINTPGIVARKEESSSHPLCIQDPFETHRNLGDVCKPHGFLAIKFEIRRALQMMIFGKNLRDIILNSE